MNTPFVSFVLAALALGACTPAPAPEPEAPAIEEQATALSLSNAWARPTPGGVDVSAGYLTITNAGAVEDQLIGASSPRAAAVELHSMTMENNVMQMRQEQSFAIPAGGSLTFGPGGAHLMFIGVTQPFTQGESIPVTLTFATAGAIETTLPVTTTAPAGAEAPHGH